jgi:hypothetical protein
VQRTLQINIKPDEIVPNLVAWLKSIVLIALYALTTNLVISQTPLLTDQLGFLGQAWWGKAIYFSLVLAVDVAIGKTLITIVKFVDQNYIQCDWEKGLVWDRDLTLLTVLILAIIANQPDLASTYLAGSSPLA